jgi:hypothetical protein
LLQERNPENNLTPLRYLLYRKVDFVLPFGNFSKNIEIIDKNLFPVGEFKIFKLRHPELGIDIFS